MARRFIGSIRQYLNADIQDLLLAGPFWGKTDELTPEKQNFYVPTPRNYLIKDGQIKHILTYKNNLWRYENDIQNGVLLMEMKLTT